MDLVAGVRKEGSRGGRGDFKWTDVKDSSHRENYLGHSVMAPVGRWQNGRDLFWYTRSDDNDTKRAQKEREEKKRVKEAEEEAMARALGLPVPPKSAASNANLTPLGENDIQRAIRDTTAGEDLPDEGIGKGVGYGSFQGGGASLPGASESDKLEEVGFDSTPRDERRRKNGRSRSPGRDRKGDRTSHRDREREHRHRRHRDERYRHHRSQRHTSRSQSRDRDRDRRRRRSHSRFRSRDRRGGDEHRRRDRNHSPHTLERDFDSYRRR